uniref:Uncharacterized protein n=1 Tax=Candidatus Kentrum sp. LPFa TaxID=2126335 RepID=A0A450WZG5_9GAMM|nr:MAG: hypothetical protein BECKLPF1236A_GA0070988_103445 [Candidatus Kentron sp. LPFa]VFK35326.1 MAG: hypothetical protein BECKLPF1236C_GA0070990_103595 [Candidatus Kentron sp. LPFa]
MIFYPRFSVPDFPGWVMKFWFRLGRVRYRKKFWEIRCVDQGLPPLSVLARSANMFPIKSIDVSIFFLFHAFNANRRLVIEKILPIFMTIFLYAFRRDLEWAPMDFFEPNALERQFIRGLA